MAAGTKETMHPQTVKTDHHHKDILPDIIPERGKPLHQRQPQTAAPWIQAKSRQWMDGIFFLLSF
jgi:hypothetical protein